jgi:hypothetical protein
MDLTQMDLHPNGDIVLLEFDGKYVLQMPAAEINEEMIQIARMRLETRLAAVTALKQQLIKPSLKLV